MYLEGQGSQRGYAMAALLVSIAVMLLLMSVALPVWRHQAQREKEAELVFRGQQYARAVNLYTRKAGPGNFPPSVDILVQQRFLRKKYKDPMTKDGEFDFITAASAQQGQNPQQGNGRGTGPNTGLNTPRSSTTTPNTSMFGGQNTGASPFGGQNSGRSTFGGNSGVPGGQPGVGGGGGIMGVRSKSKESSIRVYNGGTHYNEWNFLFSNVSNRPGVPGGNTQGMPGIPGGRGRNGSGVPGIPGPGGTGGGPGTGPGGRGFGGPGRSNVPGPFQPGRRGGG